MMDLFYTAYFVVHIPITVLIDGAMAIPRSWRFPLQQKLLDFHISQNQDFLAANPPPWMRAFLWVELLFQLPFFVYAAMNLRKNTRTLQLACALYGIEAACTTMGCLAEISVSNLAGPAKLNLFLQYAPMFLLPLYMAYDFGSRLINEPKSSPKNGS